MFRKTDGSLLLSIQEKKLDYLRGRVVFKALLLADTFPSCVIPTKFAHRECK